MGRLAFKRSFLFLDLGLFSSCCSKPQGSFSLYLNLVQVDLLVLLLHHRVGGLHGIDGRHHVLQVLGCEGRLLHVERLLLQLLPLTLVQFALLQDPHCFGLDRVLKERPPKRKGSKVERRELSYSFLSPACAIRPGKHLTFFFLAGGAVIRTLAGPSRIFFI